MASSITIEVPPPVGGQVAAAASEALGIFSQVEAACTRFDPASPLMVANREPRRWHRVPRPLVLAVAEALSAYRATGGLFDPRVHDTLVGLGYDRSLPFLHGEVTVEAAHEVAPPTDPWAPRFRIAPRMLNLGGCRVDLGGIGKGLAARWACDRMRRAGHPFLLDAGGDCCTAGSPAPGEDWRVGIESPSRAGVHLAVLALASMAVATSSTRVRRWTAGGRAVHHLIDPRSGQPAGGGLASVTVVHPDPAWAEVWSKALFVGGPEHLRREADRLRIPVAWVDDAGKLQTNRHMEPHLAWVAG